KHAHALLTLPIHKKAWEDAGLKYKGHTDALRLFLKNAIMMLGCKELFVGLFSEHIPLAKVSKKITFKNLSIFLKDFYKETHFKKMGLL
ncbi:4-hydroxythreonine-4-phosphate dehydrogenase PdxA, partial [Campylobacter jejuni]|nr:4-hydroxythreonine-4-phosphate dehydrogenase PdxA [Campylobacter jejuni]